MQTENVTRVSKRLSGIESVRVLAIFAVICLHTAPFAALASTHPIFYGLHVFTVNFCLFGVPFFFLATGYFFGHSLENGSELLALTLHYSKRLLFLFVVWSVIYGLMRPSWTLAQITEHPLGVLMEGTKYHLWFLPSMVWAIGLLSAFLYFKKEKYFLAFAFALYAFGMAAKAYSGLTHVHLPLSFDTRNGPFLSTIYVALGFALFHSRCFSPRFGLMLALFGLSLQLMEDFYLWNTYGVEHGEGLFGTVFFGTGIFIMALANPNFGEKTLLLEWAVFTLGIYLIHILFVEAFFPLRDFFPPFLNALAYPILVYVVSLVSVKILKRVPTTHFLVS